MTSEGYIYWDNRCLAKLRDIHIEVDSKTSVAYPAAYPAQILQKSFSWNAVISEWVKSNESEFQGFLFQNPNCAYHLDFVMGESHFRLWKCVVEKCSLPGGGFGGTWICGFAYPNENGEIGEVVRVSASSAKTFKYTAKDGNILVQSKTELLNPAARPIDPYKDEKKQPTTVLSKLSKMLFKKGREISLDDKEF